MTTMLFPLTKTIDKIFLSLVREIKLTTQQPTVQDLQMFGELPIRSNHHFLSSATDLVFQDSKISKTKRQNVVGSTRIASLMEVQRQINHCMLLKERITITQSFSLQESWLVRIMRDLCLAFLTRPTR